MDACDFINRQSTVSRAMENLHPNTQMPVAQPTPSYPLTTPRSAPREKPTSISPTLPPIPELTPLSQREHTVTVPSTPPIAEPGTTITPSLSPSPAPLHIGTPQVVPSPSAPVSVCRLRSPLTPVPPRPSRASTPQRKKPPPQREPTATLQPVKQEVVRTRRSGRAINRPKRLIEEEGNLVNVNDKLSYQPSAVPEDLLTTMTPCHMMKP